MMDFEVALDQFEIFILILMRMASFVYTAPFFNTSGTPQKTKSASRYFYLFWFTAYRVVMFLCHTTG